MHSSRESAHCLPVRFGRSRFVVDERAATAELLSIGFSARTHCYDDIQLYPVIQKLPSLSLARQTTALCNILISKKIVFVQKIRSRILSR
jgi:hypothetical protein